MASEGQRARGLKLLRSAATLQIASSALSVAAGVLAPLALLTLVGALIDFVRRPSEVLHRLVPLYAPLAVPAALALTAALLSAVAIYALLIPSASSLARWRGVFGTPSVLLKIGYWGALAVGLLAAALVTAGLVSFFAGAPPRSIASRLLASLAWLLSGAALALVAAVLSFVGWVGLLILLFELSSATRIEGFRTAAVVLVVAAVLSLLLPVLRLVATILPPTLHLLAWYFVRDSAGKALLPPPPPPGA